MTDYQIPLNYVVSASILPASAGLEPLQLGTILLLTDDAAVTTLTDDYVIARSAKTVGQTFGTETTTMKMAEAVFAQNPNILNNSGYLIVAPYKKNIVVTPATSGKITTVDLSTKLDAIKLVNNGDLTVTIDGSVNALTGLDCTEVETLGDLVELLQEELDDVEVTMSEGKITMTSLTTGTTSTVALSATSGGSGTDLYGTSYLDGASAVKVDGTNAVLGDETTQGAINRLKDVIYFEGILTARDLTSSEAIAASATVQAMDDRILFLTDIAESSLISGGLFHTLQSNYKTRKLLYLTGADDTEKKLNAKLFAAAYASRGLAVNYSGSNTTLTMNLKDLSIVPIDRQISENVLNKCETVGADVYCSLEGLGKVLSYAQGNYYFDQLTNRIWLLTTIQREVFNVLATTRTKIPQTEQGMQMLETACRRTCNQGVVNGMLAPGTWNSSDTFGNLDDFHRNIEEFGYYIYHLPVAQQSQSEREQRKAPVIQIACKEAGAVHFANITISIEA